MRRYPMETNPSASKQCKLHALKGVPRLPAFTFDMGDDILKSSALRKCREVQEMRALEWQARALKSEINER
jgi:hypothetical protein